MSLTQRVNQYDYYMDNRDKFNNYLRNQRKIRKRVKKLEIIKEKTGKLQDMMQNSEAMNKLNENGEPFDADFWFRMQTGLTEPHLQLTDQKDTLYVTKAIGKYEPFILNQPDNFQPDPKQVVSVKLQAEP